MNTVSEPVTLATIEALARDYARGHETLTERVRSLQEEIDALKRRRLPGIRSAALETGEAHAQLKAAIETAPHLFERPRTLTIHGIRVGLQKGKGELRISNPAATLKLIRKHLADQADALIVVTERPNKTEIARLPQGDLRRIGAEVVETGDQVVIKGTAGEIDKLVGALLKEAETASDTES